MVPRIAGVTCLCTALRTLGTCGPFTAVAAVSLVGDLVVVSSFNHRASTDVGDKRHRFFINSHK